MGTPERLTSLEIAIAEMVVKFEYVDRLHKDIDKLRATVHALNNRLWYIVGLSGSGGAIAGSGLAHLLKDML